MIMRQSKEAKFVLYVLIALEAIALFAVATSLSRLCLLMSIAPINLLSGNL